MFAVAAGIADRDVFLGIVFGFLSFAGFEAASTLGEEAEAAAPGDPRAILGTAIFGGVYFIVVTAIEMMGFGTDDGGQKRSRLGLAGGRPRARQYIASLGRHPGQPGRCGQRLRVRLACLVGASRLLFAMGRDG